MKLKIGLIIAALVLIEVKFFNGVHAMAIVNYASNIISNVLVNAIMGS